MAKPAKTKLAISVCTILILSMFLAGSAQTTSAKPSSASFGYAQIGTVSNSTFQGLYLSNFTSPGDVGNITQIEIYMATGGCTAQAVIYSDANGAPVALLTSSSTLNVEATNGSWVTFNVNYTALPKFNYWIGAVFTSAATFYHTPTINQTAIYSAPANVASALCPSGTTDANDALSIYAVYTPTSNQNQSEQWLQTLLEGIAVAAAIVAVVLLLILFRSKNQKEKQNPKTNDPTQIRNKTLTIVIYSKQN